MGVLTSNRKRGDDYFRTLSSSTPFDQSYNHISKKPKLSVPINQTTPGTNWASSSNSIVSWISQYSDKKSGFSREVHAPVSNTRFGRSASAQKIETANNSESPADKMGASNLFSRYLNYERVKDSALKALRFFVPSRQKEKEVIELDNEDEGLDGISNDSSREDVEIVDSMGRRWKGGEGTLEKEVRSSDSSMVEDVSNVVTKVDHVGKTGLSLLDQFPDNPGVPLYRRLHDSSKIRNVKLANISFDIEILEKKLRGLQLLLPPKKEEPVEKDVTEECFVPLTDDEKKEISLAFSNPYRRKVLVTHEKSCIDITGEILQCLKPEAWLNDEVINLYFELLKEREIREPQKFLKCHFFNTFFYKKLISGRGGYNFQSLRRWTSQKKLGYSLLECDKIFVPIHQDIHWCLAVINKKDEKFQYLDSLGGVDNQVLNVLAKYFVDEVKDKCGKDIDVSSWEKEFITERPQQLNGFDCGMFMMKYADFYSRDIGLRFSQNDMPYFRQRTAKEILKLRAD